MCSKGCGREKHRRLWSPSEEAMWSEFYLWLSERFYRRLLFMLGNSADAEDALHERDMREYERDVILNPTEPWAYMGRGDCRSRLGQGMAAAGDYRRAAELFAELGQIEARGTALQRMQQVLVA